jgi:hypothetical protein
MFSLARKSANRIRQLERRILRSVNPSSLLPHKVIDVCIRRAIARADPAHKHRLRLPKLPEAISLAQKLLQNG